MRSTVAILGGVWSSLLSLLVPPACLACRARTGGDALCRRCRGALPWLPAGCPRCALPRCDGRRCPAARSALAAAWAPMTHAGGARDLVVALKFRGALRVADLMAAQIAAGAPPALLAGGALVPVPTAAARRRARGFDPPLVLAAALARRTGLAVAPCLQRRDAGTRQLGAGRARRVAEGRLRIVVRGTPPPRAVLVDDVHTTGATLRACAAALRAAGCDHVSAVTYTRAI